jgi:hypothetical protein
MYFSNCVWCAVRPGKAITFPGAVAGVDVAPAPPANQSAINSAVVRQSVPRGGKKINHRQTIIRRTNPEPVRIKSFQKIIFAAAKKIFFRFVTGQQTWKKPPPIDTHLARQQNKTSVSGDELNSSGNLFPGSYVN